MNNPYLKDLKTIVFDIETTGLYPKNCTIVSASFCDPETGDVDQLFCDNPLLEKNIIADIWQRLGEYEAVITYNGDAFDFNFIITRARAWDMNDKLPMFQSVDLYKWLRKYWPLASRMQSLSQKSVEYAMGLSDERSDKIGGGECIELYSRFLQLGDENARDLILLHNADDVRQLAAIYNKLTFLPWHKIACNEGAVFKYELLSVLVRSISVEKNNLVLQGRTQTGMMPASIFADNYALEYDSFTGKVSLTVYLQNKAGYQFLDLDDLNMSDEIVLALGAHPACKDGFLIISKDKELEYSAAAELCKHILSTL